MRCRSENYRKTLLRTVREGADFCAFVRNTPADRHHARLNYASKVPSPTGKPFPVVAKKLGAEISAGIATGLFSLRMKRRTAQHMNRPLDCLASTKQKKLNRLQQPKKTQRPMFLTLSQLRQRQTTVQNSTPARTETPDRATIAKVCEPIGQTAYWGIRPHGSSDRSCPETRRGMPPHQ